MNDLALPRILGPAMATGNSRAVTATRNSEMPSTPTFQAMPKLEIHACWLTNWNPA